MIPIFVLKRLRFESPSAILLCDKFYKCLHFFRSFFLNESCNGNMISMCFSFFIFLGQAGKAVKRKKLWNENLTLEAHQAMARFSLKIFFMISPFFLSSWLMFAHTKEHDPLKCSSLTLILCFYADSQ
jgi:hypothetical protein